MLVSLLIPNVWNPSFSFDQQGLFTFRPKLLFWRFVRIVSNENWGINIHVWSVCAIDLNNFKQLWQDKSKKLFSRKLASWVHFQCCKANHFSARKTCVCDGQETATLTLPQGADYHSNAAAAVCGSTGGGGAAADQSVNTCSSCNNTPPSQKGRRHFDLVRDTKGKKFTIKFPLEEWLKKGRVSRRSEEGEETVVLTTHPPFWSICPQHLVGFKMAASFWMRWLALGVVGRNVPGVPRQPGWIRVRKVDGDDGGHGCRQGKCIKVVKWGQNHTKNGIPSVVDKLTIWQQYGWRCVLR